MTAPVTIMDEHERALDYLYGLLDGEEKARFEAHLATCARCQAELLANGRVRTAAKSVLPTVEPGERLTGALHTQLLHEAAQHASRGKVLSFVPRLVRRVVRHPAYAAAAGLLIVGGAIGLQWSRGQLRMPPPVAHEEAVVQAPPPPAVATPAAEPSATPPEPAPVVSAAPIGATTSLSKELKPRPVMHAATRAAKDEAKLDDVMLERARGGLEGRLVGGPVSRDAKNEAPADDADQAAEKSNAYADGIDKRQAYRKEHAREEANADVASSGNAQDAPATKSPASPSQSTIAQNAPPPAKSAPMMPAPSAPAATEPTNANRTNMTQAYGAMAGAGAAQNNEDTIATDRKQAATFAQQGRCDEAASLYGALDRRAPQRLTATDRLAYARCLRVLGRVEPAQNELDQLANKRVPAPAIMAEQQALNSERRKQNVMRAKAKRAVDLDQSQAPAAAAKPANKQ